MSILSPPISYYSERYITKKDRWSLVEDITSLTDALLHKLKTLIAKDKEYNILDIGCGNLWTSRIVAKKFPNVKIHGIDFAYDAITSAYPDLFTELSEQGISLEKADLFMYTPDITYDIIFDIGLFHHLIPQDWNAYVKQVDRLLQPKASFFLRSFHPDDANWKQSFEGGHERKGYYCHYHTLASLQELFSEIFPVMTEIELSRHFEHVEGLYHFKR